MHIIFTALFGIQTGGGIMQADHDSIFGIVLGFIILIPGLFITFSQTVLHIKRLFPQKYDRLPSPGPFVGGGMTSLGIFFLFAAFGILPPPWIFIFPFILDGTIIMLF